VVVGSAFNYTYNITKVILLRYNPGGQPDNSFGNNGKVITGLGRSEDYGNSVVIQVDNKIIVGGNIYDIKSNTGNFALARFNSNGNLDRSFGSDGKVFTDFGDENEQASISSVILQSDGKIIAGGWAIDRNNDIASFALARYKNNGTLDDMFGASGKVITHFSNHRDYGYSIALQRDGKILLAGMSANSNDSLAIARYKGDQASSYNRDEKVYSIHGENNNANELSHISISPVPAKNIVCIRGLSSLIVSKIFLTGNTGKILLTGHTSNNSYIFNIEQFAAGIYFVKIEEGNEIKTLQFIKE
jgi:uncharacterized delta-60 repeat protein